MSLLDLGLAATAVVAGVLELRKMDKRTLFSTWSVTGYLVGEPVDLPGGDSNLSLEIWALQENLEIIRSSSRARGIVIAGLAVSGVNIAILGFALLHFYALNRIRKP